MLNNLSLFDLLKESLKLNHTETNILWLIWDLKATNGVVEKYDTMDQNKILVQLTDLSQGVTVNDLVMLLNLDQSTIQSAISSLFSKGFLDRILSGKTYFYTATEDAFNQFKVNLSNIIQYLTNLTYPFLNATSPEKALQNIRHNLQENGWKFRGWSESRGRFNYLLTHTKATGYLDQQIINRLEKDNFNKRLTPKITQTFDDHYLGLKTEDPNTSPFHLVSHIVSIIWMLHCSMLDGDLTKKQN